MKTLRPLLVLLAFAGFAAAQAPSPAIGPSLLNIPAIRALLCPAGSCGDSWASYLPAQAANGVNAVFTAPVTASKVEVFVSRARMYQAAELPGGFTADFTVTYAAGVTTVTFTGYIPGPSDNVLIRASL